MVVRAKRKAENPHRSNEIVLSSGCENCYYDVADYYVSWKDELDAK